MGGAMEVVVDATPEQCIAALWEYFVHGEWPYQGTVHRGSNSIHFVEKEPGLISWLLLWRDLKSVNISAMVESDGRTRLYVIPGRPQYEETLDRWMREELPSQAAAAEPTARTESCDSPNIPDQIKQLAGLRDSGAITEEEFERK